VLTAAAPASFVTSFAKVSRACEKYFSALYRTLQEVAGIQGVRQKRELLRFTTQNTSARRKLTSFKVINLVSRSFN
jgi:hypothetical protein